MVGRQFPDSIYRDSSLLIQHIHIPDITLFQHLYKFHKNLRSTCSIIYCPVMIFQRNTNCFCYCIQLKSVQCRKQETGHTYCIYISKIMFNSQSVTVFHNKSHIKIRIVRNHNRALAEFKEFRKHFLDSRGIHDHTVIDTGQLFNTKRNRYLWIYKCGKTVCNLSVFYQYGTNLYDLTGQ